MKKHSQREVGNFSLKRKTNKEKLILISINFHTIKSTKWMYI